jgi:NitT/TauT family transport system substrate-binding protein
MRKNLMLQTSRGLLALCLFLLVSCAQTPAPAGPAHVTIAHWGQSKILIYLPLYVAIDGGFFEREGLNVSLKYSGNDDQVFATVVSNAAQFGVGDPAFTAISRQRGGPGKVIATLVGRLANWGVARPPGLKEITSVNQLKGLRISSFSAPSTTYTVLSEINMTNKLGLKIVQAAFGSELALLQKGEVDLAIMLEPNASVAEAQGNRVVWDLSKDYGPFLLTGVTTTDETIANQPDMCRRLVNGLQKALSYCHSNVEGTVAIAARNFPELDRKIVAAAVDRMIRDQVIPLTAEIDDSAWEKLIAMREKVGDITSRDSAAKAVTNQFTSKASH